MKTNTLNLLAALMLAGSLFTAEADDRKKTDDPRKARYLAAQRELSAAVKAGKISEADAKRRLSGLANSLWKRKIPKVATPRPNTRPPTAKSSVP